MSGIETVKIVCKENVRLGYAIINKSDLSPDDVLYDEQPEETKKPTRRKSKRD